MSATRRGEAQDWCKTLAATYDFAIHTHGSIGPSCAIADSRTASSPVDGIAEPPTICESSSPRCSALPLESVHCLYLEGSGCYGRNGHEDAAADAALMAKAVGRPVRVQWSRADEHGWDPKGPPTLIDLRAGLTAPWPRHRLGFRVLHAAADAQNVHRAAGGW